jgi:hypothetical protein
MWRSLQPRNYVSELMSIFGRRGTLVYRLLNPLSFVAFKMGRLRDGPSRTGAKGAYPSASLLVRYVSQRIRSSLAPRIQTLLKPTVCLPLMRRCTSFNRRFAWRPPNHPVTCLLTPPAGAPRSSLRLLGRDHFLSAASFRDSR